MMTKIKEIINNYYQQQGSKNSIFSTFFFFDISLKITFMASP